MELIKECGDFYVLVYLKTKITHKLEEEEEEEEEKEKGQEGAGARERVAACAVKQKGGVGWFWPDSIP